MPTGPVFRRFDEDHRDAPAPAHPEILGQKIDDLASVLRASRNDLEPAALAIAPQIADLISSMRSDPGAMAARMSGSGATCFALFEEFDLAKRAAEKYEKMGYWAMVSSIASG
jgi:4-diphosphocytidyl-2-C-methyl-D-erythritol kinase